MKPKSIFRTPRVEAIATALRVLDAINRRNPPAEKDVRLLRAYEPRYAEYSPDEVACLIIGEWLERRHPARPGRVAA